MLDDKGKVRSFAEFRKATAPIIGAYNTTWLHTEYNTAIIRAQYAQKIKELEQDRDIYPNLQWLSSTSVNPREAHRALYGKVFAFDDPVLQTNYPGSLWGCKCGIKSTSLPVTGSAEIKSALKSTPKPQPGLDTTPASGALFAASHPYFVLGYMAYNKLRPIVEKFAKRTMIKYARKRAKDYISTIPEYKGIELTSKRFITGKMTFLRGSIKQVVAHAENHQTILRVLSPEKCTKDWEYIGWSELKAGKHKEALYFTYYKTTIGKQTYYANVKMHRNICGEVLYTINSHKPKELIQGLPLDLDKYKK